MGRILALDLGDRRIGMAVSDELGFTAQGAGVYQRTYFERDVAAMAAEAGKHSCTEILIGLPKNMNGSMGPRAELTLTFSRALGEASGLPVKTWDERLTTVEAERLLVGADVRRSRRRQVIDQTAAALILQGYLDSRRYDRKPDGKT